MIPSWLGTLLGLTAVPVLVLLNAWFVAAEFSLVAVRRTRVEEMLKEGRRGAVAVKTAVTHLDAAIAATQLGITLASISLGWIGEPSLARVIEPFFSWVAFGNLKMVASHGLATAIAFLLITFLHVVLGELAPKAVALQRPDTVSLWIAQPLLWFSWIMHPLIVVMNGMGNGVVRCLGFKPLRGIQMVHSVAELGLLIEESRQAGAMPGDQAEYLKNVFRLSAKRVRDCLVPLNQMAALELNDPEEKILDAVREGAHTRMPVYEGDIQNIVGIVNTKDLFHLLSLRGMVILDDAMYPALFVAPDRPISEVLREFRRRRRPMAVVQDASGEIQGLITLEDIIEEIVGEIEDEHDPRME